MSLVICPDVSDPISYSAYNKYYYRLNGALYTLNNLSINPSAGTGTCASVVSIQDLINLSNGSRVGIIGLRSGNLTVPFLVNTQNGTLYILKNLNQPNTPVDPSVGTWFPQSFAFIRIPNLSGLSPGGYNRPLPELELTEFDNNIFSNITGAIRRNAIYTGAQSSLQNLGFPVSFNPSTGPAELSPAQTSPIISPTSQLSAQTQQFAFQAQQQALEVQQRLESQRQVSAQEAQRRQQVAARREERKQQRLAAQQEAQQVATQQAQQQEAQKQQQVAVQQLAAQQQAQQQAQQLAAQQQAQQLAAQQQEAQGQQQLLSQQQAQQQEAQRQQQLLSQQQAQQQEAQRQQQLLQQQLFGQQQAAERRQQLLAQEEAQRLAQQQAAQRSPIIDDLHTQSYTTFMKQLYGIPVELPSSLMIND